MKKITILSLFFLWSTLAFSQSRQHQAVFDVFKEHYNSGGYENIFNNFSKEMKAALPLENTKNFFDEIKFQSGNIKEAIFLKFENTSFAVYKTEFDKSILTINISIDSENLINGLYIKPFVEERQKNLENRLAAIPIDFSKIISTHANPFPNQTQLSIAILKNGVVEYYGIKIQNDTIRSVQNQDHVFEIGSITKVFTSTVLASLVVDKKLNLSDFINEYFLFPFKNNIKFNFLELANHTSGLPRLPENLDLSNTENPYKNYGKKELDNYLGESMRLESKTDLKYTYSNLGAGLLGYSLGLSQKRPFVELLEKRIFKKYGMRNSFSDPNKVRKNLVKGVDEHGNEISNWGFDVFFGGGGILSTSEDLVKFSLAHFEEENKELELTRMPTFDISDTMKIGLGWHILKAKDGFKWIWHNGGTGGYTSSIVLDTEKKNGVIILSNVSAFNPNSGNIDKLCFDLMKIVGSE
jgi:CubicO group peptidase (beta-lactamase class C family)